MILCMLGMKSLNSLQEIQAPKYIREELVKRALKMYQELDPKTGEFFEFMTERELLDLDSKPGKVSWWILYIHSKLSISIYLRKL